MAKAKQLAAAQKVWEARQKEAADKLFIAADVEHIGTNNGGVAEGEGAG